ncbi:MAG: hypothetical protein VX768_04715 [Planctomycetota bacterium]|nr:hypothetical protein [Planctomycetota bacterium]
MSGLKSCRLRWVVCLLAIGCGGTFSFQRVSAGMFHEGGSHGTEPFGIRVLDAETGRGIPLVQLRTVNGIRFFSDSLGNIAFDEPDLMNREIFFHVESHGYQFQKDGFGYRGVKLQTKPGARALVKLKRLNLAERLYRITGSGIYRDSIRLGIRHPMAQPELNAQVTGCDSVVNAVYRGKLYWFWGDTNRAGYPLGNFQVSGATSPLPSLGDPGLGIRLRYFENEKGFVRQMAPVPGKGPTWIFGAFVIHSGGQESLLAKYEKIKPPMIPYERGLVLYNDQKQQFEKYREFPLDAPAYPDGQTLRWKTAAGEHLYFSTPFPHVRVAANLEAVKDPGQYESYTCLRSGVRLEHRNGKPVVTADMLDRDTRGQLRTGWKKNAPPITPSLEKQLLAQKLIRPHESIALLQGKAFDKQEESIQLASGSVAWNDYRKKFIMIAVQSWGSSLLGEIWYAESDRLEGPWKNVVKVVTHDQYSFYNPRHHPYFDRKDGREIFFEGTYTKMFSETRVGTPRYDYNQIMYKLDLEKIAPREIESELPETNPDR